MNFAAVLGIACAALLHAGFVLFGGGLFTGLKKEPPAMQVELLSPDDAVDKEKDKGKDPPPEDKTEELEAVAEVPPDAADIIKSLELSPMDNTPALEAASLSAIEAALSGQGGSGDFAQALDFSSGGRIGATGKSSELDEKLDGAFSMTEIDQKPRAVFQAAPLYPADMRSKKVEGVVTVSFVVDSDGKVQTPRVEKSSHPSFDKPALTAVKSWKFEPAIRAGQRVACKMRVPIRFQPS